MQVFSFGSSAMSQYRRQFERVSLQVLFRGRTGAGTGVLVLESSNVSAGGTFLCSDLLLEKGEELSLEFSLPDVERVLRAQARVAWVRRFPREDQPAGMGVRFGTMPVDDRAALSTFLKAHPSTRHSPPQS